MEPVLQVVITKVDREEQGEMYKVTSFCKEGVVDSWHFHSLEEAMACAKFEVEDLVVP